MLDIDSLTVAKQLILNYPRLSNPLALRETLAADILYGKTH